MKIFILIAVSIFIMLTGNNLYSQQKDLQFSQLTTEDGLSSNHISCIFEDKAGFIWFGTQNGLNRFDGYDFEIFTNNPDDSSSIKSDYIYNIVGEKETGNLWVGTLGLNYFDQKLNKFTDVLPECAEKEEINQLVIRALLYDKKNNLWIGTNNGLFCLLSNNTICAYYHDSENPGSIIDNSITSLFEDSSGNIWIGARTGLELLNPKTGIFRHYVKNKNLHHVQCIFEARNDMWFGTHKIGLYRLKNGDFDSDVIHYGKENGYLLNGAIYNIMSDKLDNFYILDRDGGLIYFDIDNDKTYNYLPDIHNPNNINSKAVVSMIKTSTGMFYIGTYNSGVNYVDFNRKQFNHFKINFKEDGLYNNNIRSLFQDKEDNIWIGTKEEGGLSKFNRKTGTFIHYKTNRNSPFGFKDEYVFSICELDSKNLLLGTLTEGVAVFNKETGHFKHLKKDDNKPNSNLDNMVFTLFKDLEGMIWVGTVKPLQILNPDSLTFKEIKGIINVKSFCDEDSAHLWIGTSAHGLFLYDKLTNSKTNFTYDKNDTTSICSNSIHSIQKDSKNKLWLATANGLCYMDENNTFFRYTVKDGLPSNQICALLIDDHDNIWVSSLGGISKLDRKNSKFRNYNVHDGLQGNEFEKYVALKTKNGELIFGGRNGFNIFHPDNIKENTKLPKVVINGLKIFNKPVTVDSEDSPLDNYIIYSKHLTFKHWQSVITFSYSALNYSSPEKNQYAYMLEGFDKDWNYVEDKRTATYTNLPAGDYVFRVKASNNDGYWNNKGKSIKITVLPPWWKTWWFILLCTVLISFILVGFYFYRINLLKEQKKILEQTVSVRTYELKQANIELEEQQEELTNMNVQLMEQKDNLQSLLNKLKETQSQLVQSEKMASLGILAAGIAHEINNPLTFIQCGKYAIENYIDENIKEHSEMISPFIEQIDKGIYRASAIIKSLYKFSQKSDNYSEHCDIHSIINNCITMLSNQLKNKIKIKLNYTTNEYVVIGNEGDLHQVFFNIIINSIQSISSEGNIKISSYNKTDKLFVEISDDGHGISLENIKKVTDPFFTTKDPGKGIGLGMSISYSIIKKHKGDISYFSEEDKGTTVTVTLPL